MADASLQDHNNVAPILDETRMPHEDVFAWSTSDGFAHGV